MKVSALRMAKYSYTSIEYFLSLPLAEFKDWTQIINAEIQRENEDIKRKTPKAK